MSARTLWGVWVAWDDDAAWHINNLGNPTFSTDRRLIAAHVVAHNGIGPGPIYSVRKVGDGGHPVDDEPSELEKALADFETAVEPHLRAESARVARDMAIEEDIHFLPDGKPALAVHPGLADMTSRPDEGMTEDGMRQLTYEFMALPHHVRVWICDELGLPTNDRMDGAHQFIPAFCAARENGQVAALRQLVKAANNLTK